MKNLINRIFIKIDKIINARFDILIIIINIIQLFIVIRFKYIDFDLFIITILFKSLIFLKRDLTIIVNLIYKI